MRIWAGAVAIGRKLGNTDKSRRRNTNRNRSRNTEDFVLMNNSP